MSFLPGTANTTWLFVFFVVVLLQIYGLEDMNFDEKPTKYLCEFLIETDRMLDKEYRARPKGNGETIMNMVRNYNKAMTAIVERVKDDLNQGKNSTISKAKDLIDHGGPEFINFHVDTPLLEELFGLNNISSKILQIERQNTINLWHDFFKYYSRIPDEDDVSYV